jgi:glutamyl/glutaminyl-tRNA synthetase
LRKTHPGMQSLKTRFAPTPSGLLHPGNGLSFIITWVLARAAGASILLRIDDLDEQRRRLAYVEDIFYTLDWLGLDYDEGPAGVDDFLAHWSQRSRMDLYLQALGRLRHTTDGLYACCCTHRQLQASAVQKGIYAGSCRRAGLSLDLPEVAWRLHVPEETRLWCRGWGGAADQYLSPARLMGDFVVRKKDGDPAYQLSSVVDDLHFGVTAVVRGMDLLPSTAAQLYLASVLKEDVFLQLRFFHHPLLLDGAGEKLSKSQGAGSLQAWREAGHSPARLLDTAARWLGLTQPAGGLSSATALLALLKAERSAAADNLQK